MESMTCPTCGTKTLILVRSIEHTFYCGTCKKWKPCPPVPETGYLTKKPMA